MVRYQGKGVYGAIAVGKVLKWKREDVQVKREKIEDTAQNNADLSDSETELSLFLPV